MNHKIVSAAAVFSASLLLVMVPASWALTPEQVIALKNAGVSDQTIQLMIQQEQEAAKGSPDDSAIRKEIKDKDGKSVIIYSTGRPAGKDRLQEDKQTEKAWEMLRNTIIDTRTSK